jgi:hypothetical protein
MIPNATETTIFTTAFMSIYNTEEAATVLRSAKERIGLFVNVAKTGIPIRVFVCPVFQEAVREAIAPYPNVQIHRVLSLAETRTYSILEPYRENLPATRSQVKDTFEYMTLMSAKMEFVQEIMNAYEYEQYAWIDFNIWFIIRGDFITSYKLKLLAHSHLESDTDIYMPGCWNWKTKGINVEGVWSRILWRFCGGFFIGRANAMRDYCARFIENLGKLVSEKQAITWEVNIWHLMESRDLWTPIWYSADHNDSILSVPMQYIRLPIDCESILHEALRIPRLCGSPGVVHGTYPILPKMQGFCPSSIAFCRRGDGARVLNVRYVNYELTPQGAYIIHHPNGSLYTKNMGCILGDDYSIQSIHMIADKPANLVSRNDKIQGIEDIRLFEAGGELRFIATQREFSQDNVNRMAVGVYSLDRLAFENTAIVEPPQFTGCEKNWVPLVRRIDGDSAEERVQYIYSWGPIRLGEIATGSAKLEIRDTIESPADAILGRMKGSTTFVDCSDGTLLGVIHYSEEGAPRKYFHCLLRLDAVTLRPIAISNPFVFQRLGIEFCIGFDIEECRERIRFWYSQHDRSPEWCSVPLSSFLMYPC